MAHPSMARLAEEQISKRARRDERLRDFASGERQPLPYAPDRSDPAHLYLREQACIPTLKKAVSSLTSRLRVSGIHTGDATLDGVLMGAWKAAGMDSRSRAAIEDGVVIARGVASVWPNDADPARPSIIVEDPAACHFEPSTEAPATTAWAAKLWSRDELTRHDPPRLVKREMCTIYEPGEVTVYAKRAGRWELEDLFDEGGNEQANPMPNPLAPHLPLVELAPDRDTTGQPRSWMAAMIPGARAINTLRFDMLLSGHAAAHRQLFISGFDPVQRDEHGQPMIQKNADGTPVLDEHGYPMPVLKSPKAGPTNIITFTSSDTEVDSVEPVDLANYVAGINYLTESFAGMASMPVTAIGGTVSQTTGETLEQAGMEQTALVSDIQQALGEDLERLFEVMAAAIGHELDRTVTGIEWSGAKPRTLSQVGSFISQTAPHGVPARVGLEMLPGVTPEQVDEWLDDEPAAEPGD